MRYWLMKSEPDVFSLADLKARPGQREPWDGVRNYQARNFMRDAMQKGDTVLFYHSNTNPPGIVGLAEVASDPYPDPTAFDKKSKYYDAKSDPENPRWILVDVRYCETFSRMVTLEAMKAMPALAEMRVLQRGNRLSITPVTAAEFKAINKAGLA
ncbi:MAG: EVE domain-containing protein [Verrucomicrobia bacterium]|nr:EVE domain-containing protein [Verrucomicrobiota bacterium]